MKKKEQLNELLKKSTASLSSRARKEKSKRELGNFGPDIIPFLLEKWDTNPPLKICNVIIDVILSMGDASFTTLWDAILKERSLPLLSNRLYLLSKFPVVKEFCIPYLLLIVSPSYYENGITLTLGDKDLNKSTLPIIKQLPGDLVYWYVKQPDDKKDKLIFNAFLCLEKTNKAGRKYLKSFQDLYSLHNWSSKYIFMDKVIRSVENS